MAKEKNEALILYSCNTWHEHSSKELIGVFTDTEKLSDYVNDMKSAGKLTEEEAGGLMEHYQTQGLRENYMIEEEALNPLCNNK